MNRPAKSLEALMTGLIDYAGIYPPASLSLEEAIDNYGRYLHSDEAWMLGHFIMPAARLHELTPNQLKGDKPFTFSVIGRRGKDAEESQTNLEQDEADIRAFYERHGERVRVVGFEVKVPAILEEEADFTSPAYMSALDAVADKHQININGQEAKRFIEVPFSMNGEIVQQTLYSQQAQLNMYAGRPQLGAKLRCGGVEAHMFPTPTQIAQRLVDCRDNGLYLKCTAGLHHPIRHFDDTVNTKMHGFLNVFVAGILAQVHHMLAVPAIEPIIADEDPSHFTFDEEQLAWGKLAASVSQIQAARRSFMMSYGSCSFDEPRQDLQALGLLN